MITYGRQDDFPGGEVTDTYSKKYALGIRMGEQILKNQQISYFMYHIKRSQIERFGVVLFRS